MTDDSRIDTDDAVFPRRPAGSMKRQLAIGAGWMTGLQLLSKVIEIGFIAVLARILFPADFGVIAGAAIFIQLASLLVEVGIGATIVQIPNLTRTDLRIGGTIVVLNGVGYFTLAQVLAPFAGDFMGIPGTEPVIRVLALVFIIQSFGIVSENVLVRDLEVRRVMVAQLMSRVIGTGVIGIALAWAGLGYWALVVATLAETSIKATWLVLLVRPPMRPLLTRPGAARLMRRGAGFSLAKVINFFALRADNAIVGRTMDAAALGLYSRAYNLMNVPADLYSRIAERIVFPAMAKVQDDPVRLRSAFLRGLELTAVFGLPISALLALLAPEVILFILGPRWVEVIVPFAVLCSVTYLRLGTKVSGSLQRAKAATGAMITNQIVYAGMVIGGCLIAYPHGIVAVATAVSIAVVAFYLIVNYNACRLAGVGLRDFARVHGHGALLALACTLAAAPVVFGMRAAGGLPPIAILGASGAAIAVLGVILIVWRPRWLLGAFVIELLGDAGRATDRFRKRKARS
ncbi:lipopolysaccharide biosynthesis protein [Sphingomonas yantingensis]|uniref:PST family polysaccharide transporter n=1 Tax=Sphingomonas yantingensis TaxID=1241761 RepID=A0A7W9ARU4_9SPHN|nr:lipopolysaccharide biosynthesis protein [Sphingomonas yantingensis]MBB5699307.1 PST family polysaccharide transporter [Sphingomonas yantingensis]